MVNRALNPVVFVAILAGSSLLLALHAWSLRKQIMDMGVQVVHYRRHLQRVTREKREMRMTLGHLQRAMEKHQVRAKSSVNLEEKLQKKDLAMERLHTRLTRLKLDLDECQNKKRKGQAPSASRVVSSGEAMKPEEKNHTIPKLLKAVKNDSNAAAAAASSKLSSKRSSAGKDHTKETGLSETAAKKVRPFENSLASASEVKKVQKKTSDIKAKESLAA